MKIEMTFEGARVEGAIEGKAFSVIKEGPVTKIVGINDNGSFGGLVASKLLRFCSDVLDGANVVIAETDDLNVWQPLDEDVAQQVEDAMV